MKVKGKMMEDRFSNLYQNITLLRANEVARVLNISRALAYRLMQTGKIPTVRINRSVRVRREDLESNIQNNLVSFDVNQKKGQIRWAYIMFSRCASACCLFSYRCIKRVVSQLFKKWIEVCKLACPQPERG